MTRRSSATSTPATRLRLRASTWRRYRGGPAVDDEAVAAVMEGRPPDFLEVGAGRGELAQRIAAECSVRVTVSDISRYRLVRPGTPSVVPDYDDHAWSPTQMRPAPESSREAPSRTRGESRARFVWLLLQTIGFTGLIAQDAGHHDRWHAVALIALPISWLALGAYAVAGWRRRRRTG